MRVSCGRPRWISADVQDVPESLLQQIAPAVDALAADSSPAVRQAGFVAVGAWLSRPRCVPARRVKRAEAVSGRVAISESTGHPTLQAFQPSCWACTRRAVACVMLSVDCSPGLEAAFSTVPVCLAGTADLFSPSTCMACVGGPSCVTKKMQIHYLASDMAMFPRSWAAQ